MDNMNIAFFSFNPCHFSYFYRNNNLWLCFHFFTSSRKAKKG
ncbi:Uncharacterised protein [Mycobacterium tuberculosis]|nr:Uncharacterised protein [Mycobacterium tuberculosis]